MRISAVLSGVVWFLRKFHRDASGATALIFALSAVSLVSAGGVGVDLARALVVKNRMAAALDAAGLAVGKSSGLTEAEMEALAQKYFDANFKSQMGTADAVDVKLDGDKISLSVSGSVPTSLMKIAGFSTVSISAANEVVRGSVNLEVALALDITGSMSGSKIADLRKAAKDLMKIVVQDVQTPYYSKVALAPFSLGVNLGSYAASARGPVAAPKSITGATWINGSSKTITAVTKASPARVTTSSNHGLSTGDRIYISGVGGMTQLNNKEYTITKDNNTRFFLNSTNSSGYSNFTSGGTVRECITSACEVVVTSSSHGFAAGDYIVVKGVNGMTQINNTGEATWTVATAPSNTTNTFVLSGSNGPSYGTYSSGGDAYCTEAGCRYYRFTNADWWGGSTRLFEISTCASERIGAQAYTDAAPGTNSYAGRVYLPDPNDCPSDTIYPLSSDKVELQTRINNLKDGGTTAGQIGLAWAWYLVSPNFASIWPSGSKPAAYNTDKLVKVVVLMTDGEFNTGYCNGVVSKDSGAGSSSDRINCNATNGDPFDQAATLCTKMKNAGVVVYTVAFDINSSAITSFMSNCATSSDHYYNAADGTALNEAFVAIAQDINSLRLSK